ncbi:hypothetical protein KP79_PYT01099 [Mizuhopecten yessoensis]|uniref:Uncharacterized protein n=1 Tax=Mizuhopecten yessoensis TaxID=6573 RepID=A0A210QKI0_MIZYE|nr:hypothetical protein KP79_PYT01099 [Mizuhopecten yessoensis]
MAAIAGRTRLEVEDISSKATVPNNHRAKLMYYLSSVTTVLDMDDSDSANLRRLCDYSNYSRLSSEETSQLILLCALLSPDVLLNKCIFADDDMCGEFSNSFYKISAVRSRVMVSSSIMIAGQNRSVNKVMFFKMEWLRENYLEPIKYFADEMAAEKRRQERLAKKKDCVIL